MALVVLALLASRALGGSSDLRVNDVSGLDDPWPLVDGTRVGETAGGMKISLEP